MSHDHITRESIEQLRKLAFDNPPEVYIPPTDEEIQVLLDRHYAGKPITMRDIWELGSKKEGANDRL